MKRIGTALAAVACAAAPAAETCITGGWPVASSAVRSAPLASGQTMVLGRAVRARKACDADLHARAGAESDGTDLDAMWFVPGFSIILR